MHKMWSSPNISEKYWQVNFYFIGHDNIPAENISIIINNNY